MSRAPSQTDPQPDADVTDRRPRLRSFTVTAAAIASLILITSVVTLVLSLNEEMDHAIAAFRAGDLEAASTGFAHVIVDEPENVTARLYLARIYRRTGAYDQAREELQRAVTSKPEDTGVRRELGYLFLELKRPALAAEQFQHALDTDPEDESSWIGLIVALRADDDPSAAEVLHNAPTAVRALLAQNS